MLTIIASDIIYALELIHHKIHWDNFG